MFDGNTFLPVTGTPMRKMACMMRPLAEAEPVPLAVAILKAKSLTRFIKPVALGNRLSAFSGAFGACETRWSRAAESQKLRAESFLSCQGRLARFVAGNRQMHHELAHIPRIGGAPLGAQTTVHANVLVFHHQPARLLQSARHKQ